MSNRKNMQKITIGTSGGSFTVDVTSPQEYVHITSATAVTLSSAATISTTGTAYEGTYIRFIFDGSFTTDTATGKHISVFGTILPNEIALYEAEITAYYDGSTWEIRVFPSVEGNANIDGASLEAGTVATAALADDAVTNDKLNSISRGSIKVGGASNAPTDLDASTDGYILIGNGTDINSVAVTGDVTISNTGVTTISAGAVDEDMLSFSLVSYKSITTQLTSTQVLDMCTTVGGTAVQLIGAPGAGKLIQVVKATAFLDYNSAAYAAGGNVILNYDASGGNAVATISSACVTSAVDATEEFDMNTPLLTTSINQPLYIENLSASFTTGNSPLYVHIVYNIIDFN